MTATRKGTIRPELLLAGLVLLVTLDLSRANLAAYHTAPAEAATFVPPLAHAIAARVRGCLPPSGRAEQKSAAHRQSAMRRPVPPPFRVPRFLRRFLCRAGSRADEVRRRGTVSAACPCARKARRLPWGRTACARRLRGDPRAGARRRLAPCRPIARRRYESRRRLKPRCVQFLRAAGRCQVRCWRASR